MKINYEDLARSLGIGREIVWGLDIPSYLHCEARRGANIVINTVIDHLADNDPGFDQNGFREIIYAASESRRKEDRS